MNRKIIEKNVESFFLSENLKKIDKEYENLCEEYRKYQEYIAAPYEDNEPLSHLESDAWSYMPVFRKKQVFKPSESKYEKNFFDLFLSTEIIDYVWDSLSEERRKILAAKSNQVALKYWEVFGRDPIFISNKFW